jgi:hypothetical protein
MAWHKVVYPAFAGVGAVAGWFAGGPVGAKAGAAMAGGIAVKAIAVNKLGKAADEAGKKADEAAQLLLKTAAKVLDIGANVVLGGYGLLTLAWTGQYLSGWYKDKCASGWSNAHCISLDLGSACFVGLVVAGGWETLKVIKVLYGQAKETIDQKEA